MSDHRLQGGGFISLSNIFHFEGATFEFHSYLGLMKCRKDGEPSKQTGGKKFFAAFERWSLLPKAEQEKYRIYG